MGECLTKPYPTTISSTDLTHYFRATLLARVVSVRQTRLLFKTQTRFPTKTVLVVLRGYRCQNEDPPIQRPSRLSAVLKRNNPEGCSILRLDYMRCSMTQNKASFIRSWLRVCVYSATVPTSVWLLCCFICTRNIALRSIS
jgi:hypothetical protein